MTATLYKWLIGLHPRAFRERHGAEMCCAFDDAAGKGTASLLLDGLTSLVRQWVFRSGAWKPAAGLAISAIFIFAWAFVTSTSYADRVGRALIENEAKARARTPLNHAEFNEEAAQAVAMLARFRRADELRVQSRPASRTDSRSSRDSSRN